MDKREAIINYILDLDAHVDACYANMLKSLELTIPEYLKTVHFLSRVTAQQRPPFIYSGVRQHIAEYEVLQAYTKGIRSSDPTRNKSVEVIADNVEAALLRRKHVLQ